MADLAVQVEEPASRSRHRFLVPTLVVGVLALVAAISFWSWSGTGGRLRPSGNGIDVPAAVGAPIYIGYQLDAQGGDVTIDSISLRHGSPSVTATFFVAGGPCPIGSSASVPDSCDLQPPAGTHLSPSVTRWMVAEYVPTTDGTFDPGQVVVSYHSGLHRRAVDLGTSVCISTTASCDHTTN